MMKVFEIGVDVDTDAISRAVAAKAETEAVAAIVAEAKNKIGQGHGWSSVNIIPDLISNEVSKIMAEHKDRIITLAAHELAVRLIRTKAVREAIGTTIAEA